MKKLTKYAITLLTMFLLSCRSMIICPAFQSTYILDDSVRNAHFSYVWQLDEESRSQFLSTSKNQVEDTINNYSESNSTISATYIPSNNHIDYYAYAQENTVVPWRNSKRTKYGIVKKTFYPIRNYQLKTAPMENVFSAKVSMPKEQSNVQDSLVSDSTLVMDHLLNEALPIASQNQIYKYNYDPADLLNVEQEYYNKYYGELLINKTPKLTRDLETNKLLDRHTLDSTRESKSFFKKLFRKKTNNESDSITSPIDTIPKTPSGSIDLEN